MDHDKRILATTTTATTTTETNIPNNERLFLLAF